MTDDEARFLATCDDCGAVYAATRSASGDVLPIGRRAGCRCGSTSFSRVEDSEDRGDDRSAE